MSQQVDQNFVCLCLYPSVDPLVISYEINSFSVENSCLFQQYVFLHTRLDSKSCRSPNAGILLKPKNQIRHQSSSIFLLCTGAISSRVGKSVHHWQGLATRSGTVRSRCSEEKHLVPVCCFFSEHTYFVCLFVCLFVCDLFCCRILLPYSLFSKFNKIPVFFLAFWQTKKIPWLCGPGDSHDTTDLPNECKH
jgi:hypothetical protein